MGHVSSSITTYWLNYRVREIRVCNPPKYASYGIFIIWSWLILRNSRLGRPSETRSKLPFVRDIHTIRNLHLYGYCPHLFVFLLPIFLVICLLDQPEEPWRVLENFSWLTSGRYDICGRGFQILKYEIMRHLK